MATNLSPLLTDAFTIYSEAYTRISEIGVEVAELAGSPRQPRKINQLIEATRLFRVITPSINLNAGGTAIEGITGDVATINNLLLKLKKSVGLYSVPVFPTPLSNIDINLGSNFAINSSFVTASVESLLPDSRRLVGSGLIVLADGGAQGDLTIGTNVSATNRIIGRITSGAGAAEELTGTQATTLLNVFTDALKGLAPASGGGTTNFLRADGQWAPATISVPGSNTQVIFNDGGVLGTNANFTFTSNTLTVRTVSGTTGLSLTSNSGSITSLIKHLFTAGSVNPGINIGSFAGDPSSLSNGDIWYNSTTGKFRGREAGVSVNLTDTGISGLATGTIPKAASATSLNDSIIFQSGTIIGIGTTSPFAGVKLEVLLDTAATSSASPPLVLTTTTTGTPGIGIGSGVAFRAETSVGNIEIGGQVSVVSEVITPGSEAFNFTVSLQGNGSNHQEVFNIQGSSLGNTRIGASAYSITAAERRLHVVHFGGATNTVFPIMKLSGGTAGTPAIGTGISIEFDVATGGSNREIGSTIEAVTTNIAAASENFDLVFKTMAGGATAAERLRITSSGDLKIATLGAGVYVPEGSNATMGTATLSGGSVVVNTTKVTANSRIFVFINGGTVTNVGVHYISAITPGTSFTISSNNGLDASTVAWIIIQPS